MNCFGSRKKNSYTVNEEMIVSEESGIKGKTIKEEQDGKRSREEKELNGENGSNGANQLETDAKNEETQSKNAPKKDKPADKKKDKKLNKKKDSGVAEELENQEKSDNKKKEKADKKSKKKEEEDKKKDKKSNKKESDGKNQKVTAEEAKKTEDVQTEKVEETKLQILTTAVAPRPVETIETKSIDENVQELVAEAGELTDITHELNGGNETNDLQTETHELLKAETSEQLTGGTHESTTQTDTEADGVETETRDLPEETAVDSFDFFVDESNHKGKDDDDEIQETMKEDSETSEHRSSALLQDQIHIRCGSSTPPPEDPAQVQDPAAQDEDIDEKEDRAENIDHQRRFPSDSDLTEAQATFEA